MRIAWIAFLLMIACVSWAQAPNGGGTPGHRPSKTCHVSQQTKECQYSTKDSPFPVTVLPTPEDAAHTTGREQTADQFNKNYLGSQIRLAVASEKQASAAFAAAVIVGIETAITFVALWLLWKTFRETRRTANAAMQSAQAAMGVALPNLWLYKLEFGEMGSASLEARLQSPKITVTVKNYGGTPAFIQQQGIGIFWGHILPDEPDYSEHAFDVDQETVIDSSAAFDLDPVRPQRLVPPEDIRAIIGQKQHLWVYGYIQYMDFLNFPHIRRFCKQYVMGGINPDAYRFVDWTANPKYTEST